MSKSEVDSLNEERRSQKGPSVKDAIKRAKQHLRNIKADELEEPEALASGDMKKFLDDPEAYEKDTDNE